MTKREETTRSRQLAEKAAVDIVGRRNAVLNPLDPIEWIQERKVVLINQNKSRVAIRFLFQVGNSHTFTAVEVLLMNEDKKWHLLSAYLESEFQPGKPNKEKWAFLPDGTPQKVST